MAGRHRIIGRMMLVLGPLIGCAQTGETSEETVAPSSATDTAAPATAELEVREVLDRHYRTFSARDWDSFRSNFWPGAMMTAIWTPAGRTAPEVVGTSIPDFIAQAPEGPGSREIFEESLISVKITEEAGLAQAWARYRARFGDPGDITEWEGYDAFTLLKHEGEWKITSLSYAADPG